MKRILYLLIVILGFSTANAQVAGYHGKRLSAGFNLGLAPSIINLNSNFNNGFFSFNSRYKLHVGYVISDRLNVKLGFAAVSSGIILKNSSSTNFYTLDTANQKRGVRIQFNNLQAIVHSKVLSLGMEYYPSLPIPLVGVYLSFDYNYYMNSLEYESSDFGYYYYKKGYDWYQEKEIREKIEDKEETKSFGDNDISTSFSIFTVGAGIKRVIKNRIIIDFGVDFGLSTYWNPNNKTNIVRTTEKEFIDGNGDLDEWEKTSLSYLANDRANSHAIFFVNIGVGYIIF